MTSNEIRQRLDARAGRSLSALPSEAQAVWMPILTLLLGVFTLGLLVRRMRRRRVAVEVPPASAEDDEMDARLDEELALLD